MSDESKNAILDVIRTLYQALNWGPDKAPGWEAFKSCFHESARLYPSARPMEAVSVDAFVERMDAQRKNGNLASFSETMLGEDVLVFGNVAVAFSAYETLMNDGDTSRGLNAFHFAHDGNEWKVLTLAWDNASADLPLPDLPRVAG